MAVYNISVYWTNRQDASLHRVYFDTRATATAASATGSLETVLVSGMGSDVREVRLIRKSDLATKGRHVLLSGVGTLCVLCLCEEVQGGGKYSPGAGKREVQEIRFQWA